MFERLRRVAVGEPEIVFPGGERGWSILCQKRGFKPHSRGFDVRIGCELAFFGRGVGEQGRAPCGLANGKVESCANQVCPDRIAFRRIGAGGEDRL